MAAHGRAEFDPKEIASAAFPTAFRGYDQESVRQYLTRLAAAVGRAQQLGLLGSVDYDEGSAHVRAAEAERETAELRARVVELEELLEADFDTADGADDNTADDNTADDNTADDNTADGADDTDAGADTDLDVDAGVLVADPTPGSVDSEPLGSPAGTDGALESDDAGERRDGSGAIDEAELIEHLGQETANILEVARSAAADIVKRADDEAALIKNEAAVNSRTIRDEAEEALAAARTEAARILDAAGDEAAQSQERLEAEAQRAYDDARAEADRIVTDAAAKVETDLASARLRAAQIVADAEGVRDEVMGDLVRRRRVHRSQLSRLTDARDRLAHSLATARSELDEVATTIEVATGEDGIDLTDPEPVTEALDDEAVAELIDRLDRVRAAAGTAPAVENGRAATSANGHPENDDTVRLQTLAGPGVENGVASDGALAVDAAQGVVVVEADDPPVEVDAAHGADLEVEDDVLVGESVVVEGDDVVTSQAEDYQGLAARTIDELNGPLDGDRLLDQLGFAEGPVLGSDDGAMGRQEARGDLPRTTPFPGRLPNVFEERDIALAKANPGFRRRLKRAVNDDQSDVLDRLRAGRKEIQIEELPLLEEQLTGYIAALTPALRDVVVAGARVLGCDDAPLPAVDNLCLQLAKHIVDNLRLPTIDVIVETPTDDREAILDPVRAIYRDFRNGLLPDLIDDALHEAFALGVFHGVDPDRQVLWVADPRLDPDPICEENSASPPLPKGTDFPSGHARPLSMPGCRCLAVPAD